jgi:hypothetical protein
VPFFLFSAAATQPSTRPCAARPSSRSSPLQPGSTAGRARACSLPSMQRPSWPSGASRRQPAPRLRAPCAANQWGPGIVPYLASDSTRTPSSPPESERSTPPPHGPHAKESARGYLRPPPSPRRPIRAIRATPSPSRKPPTLGFRRCRFSPPTPLHRQGAAPEKCLEVRRTVVSLVFELER